MRLPPLPTLTVSEGSDDRYLYSRRHAWTAFALVMALQLFDFIDRQVLAALLPSIKAEWRLSDTALGMLVGAVNVAIAVFILPVSVLVDRWSRTRCISLMGVVWSVATVACGMAGGFWQLLAARFFVGAGEAGYGTASTNLLAKVFPRRMRAGVIGLKESGALIGSVIGVVLGGYIAKHYGWRYAFGVVAAPGFLFALLILFLRDYPNPVRAAAAGASAGWLGESWHAAKQLARVPALRWIAAGTATLQMFVASIGNWMPSFFNRVYALPPDQAGARTGLVILVASVGVITFGFLGDRLAHARPVRYVLLMSVLALITGSASLTAYSLAPGATQMAALMVAAFFMLGILGASFTAIQGIVQPGMWGIAIGLYLLINNLVGVALGPLLAGALSDRLSLQGAMQVFSLVPFFSAFAYFMAARNYEHAALPAA